MNESGDIELKKIFLPLTYKKTFWIYVTIALLVFFNMLFNKFVWDDRAFIEFNPDVLRIDIPYLLGANMFNNVDAGHYRFLPGLYLTIFHHIFWDKVFFYHIFHLGFHILNTYLIFYLFSKFIKKEMAFFVGLIFLIHPMQVESVSYIASIDSSLFSILGISSLVLNLTDKISWKKILAIFSLIFLALLAKETAFLFLLLIIFYRFLFLKHYRWLFVALGIVTFVPYLYIRLIYAGVWFSSISLAPIARLEFTERLLNIPGVVFYYLKTFLWPMKLSIIQFWIMKKVDLMGFYLPLLGLLAFITVAVFFGIKLFQKNTKQFKLYVFFSTWLVVGVGLYSHLFHLDMTVSDRWFYFGMIGLLGLIGLVLNLYYPFILKNKQLFVISGIIIISFFSIRTIVRNMDWKDPITLYSHDRQIYENYDLENNLGGELNMIGRKDEAYPYFVKSVELFPHETNLFNLGMYYQSKGDLKKAEHYLQAAIDAPMYGQVPKPHKHQSLTYEKFAGVLLKTNPKKCLEITKMGIADYHEKSAQLWYTQALCFYKIGDNKNALESAKEAHRLQPANYYTNLIYKALLEGKGITVE